MDNFAAVTSLIRAGLAGDVKAVEKQTARLRARLEKQGAHREAETLARLLEARVEAARLEPSRVTVSRVQAVEEPLTPDVHPPIDRESGGALCTISFPDDREATPILEGAAQAIVSQVIGEWSNHAVLSDVGVHPTRSILMFGPPGAGKTMTARHLARSLDLPLVTARIDGLISSFLGSTARNIANLFGFANRYRCALLLDEFDGLAKLRDDAHEVGEIKRVVNTLLQNLDDRDRIGVTFAITNHEALLDPAIWRRFEVQLAFGAPGRSVREALIERALMPIAAPPETIALFAYLLDGLSGADIERTCLAAKRTLALAGESRDGPGLFRSMAAVLARSPAHGSDAARQLAMDPAGFIGLAASDPALGLTQVELGTAVGYGQSRISDLKKLHMRSVRHEVAHAE